MLLQGESQTATGSPTFASIHQAKYTLSCGSFPSQWWYRIKLCFIGGCHLIASCALGFLSTLTKTKTWLASSPALLLLLLLLKLASGSGKRAHEREKPRLKIQRFMSLWHCDTDLSNGAKWMPISLARAGSISLQPWSGKRRDSQACAVANGS